MNGLLEIRLFLLKIINDFRVGICEFEVNLSIYMYIYVKELNN